MTVVETKSRRSAPTPPRERDTSVSAQAKLLDTLLPSLHLYGIKVNPYSAIRYPAELGTDRRMTFGYIGAFAHDSTFVTAIATGQDKRVASYFVTATDEHSGLLADDATKTLYTDSFWRLTDDILEHVIPTEPIPLDGIYMCYDGLEKTETVDPIVRSQYSDTTYRFFKTAVDKQLTKTALLDKG